VVLPTVSRTWRAGRARLLFAVRAAEKGDGLGGSGVGVPGDAGPGASLRVPEEALELIGIRRAVGQDPAEQNVFRGRVSELEKLLPQIDVVPTDALGHAASRTDRLDEEDARAGGGNGAGNVALRQTNGRLDALGRRQAGKERWLRRVGEWLLEPRSAGSPHLPIV